MNALTKEEREKFAAWCEEDARQNNQLAAQAGNLPGMGPVVKMLKTEAMAMTVVARKLRQIEDMNL